MALIALDFYIVLVWLVFFVVKLSVVACLFMLI